MIVTADRIEAISIPTLLEVPVYKMTNLRFNNTLNSDITTVVNEKVFLFQFDFYFFHQIHEVAGQFEVLKSVFSDLKVIFVQQNVDSFFGFTKVYDNDEFFKIVSDIGYATLSEETKGQNTHKYFEGLVDLYKSDAINNNVYSLKSGNYLFKEVYFMFEGAIPLFSNRPHGVLQHGTDLLKLHGHAPYWQNDDYMNVYLDKAHRYYSWHIPAMKLYMCRLNEYVTFDDSFPKKIYISRKDVRARYLRLIKDVKDENSVNFFKSRTFDESEFLEPYFESKGYKSIVFQGMPLLEQLKYIKNATHIAGLVGSSFVNGVACQPGAHMYEIHVDSKYTIDYTYLCEMAGAKNIRIFLQDCASDPKEMQKKLDQAGV